MAGSRILVPLYICVLGLVCCGSVADSRAVTTFFKEQYHEAWVADNLGIDDGPKTFTMQDHFNFLRERELARRGRGDMRAGTTSRLDPAEVEEELVFVEDYRCTGSNKLHDPSLSGIPDT